MRKKSTFPHRLFSAWLGMLLAVSFSVPVRAQGVLNLPKPGTMIAPSISYHPSIMAGMTIYPDNPLKFDFLITTGDDRLQGKSGWNAKVS